MDAVIIINVDWICSVTWNIGKQILLLKQRHFSSNLLKDFLIVSLLYKANKKTITVLVYFL